MNLRHSDGIASRACGHDKDAASCQMGSTSDMGRRSGGVEPIEPPTRHCLGLGTLVKYVPAEVELN